MGQEAGGVAGVNATRPKKTATVGMTAHGLPGMHGAGRSSLSTYASYGSNRRVGDTLRTKVADPWGGKFAMTAGLSHRMIVRDTHYVAAPKTARAMRGLQNRMLRKLGGRTGA